MTLHRTLLLPLLSLSACLSNAFAADKLDVMLDWFVNPDHATLVIAKQKGFFAKHGLDVNLLEPADPALPPKLVAADKIDLAVDTQPTLQMAVSEGAPLIRIATLVATPLHEILTLKKSGIRTLADLKGKTIGYTVSGVDEKALQLMLASAGLKADDVKLINVNWSLSPSLISGKVDAVNGAYRNFEPHNLAAQGYESVAFYPEEHGIPSYDELVIETNASKKNDPRLPRFLDALEEATVYTLNHPDEAWQAFIAYKPETLDNTLNKDAWQDTLPRFAKRPRAVDIQRYATFGQFLQQHGLIQKPLPNPTTYAVDIDQP